MQTLRSLGTAKAPQDQGLSSLSSTTTPKPERERRERKSLLKKPLRSPAAQANVQTDAAAESPLLHKPDDDARAPNADITAAQRRKSRDPNRDKSALNSSNTAGQSQQQPALAMPWSSLACSMRCFASLPWRRIGKMGSLQPVVAEAELPKLSEAAETSLRSVGNNNDAGAKPFCIELEVLRTDELQFGICIKPQVRIYVVDLCTGRMLHPMQMTLPASFLTSKQQPST